MNTFYHIEHDYFVEVEKLKKENSCKVTFPTNILYEPFFEDYSVEYHTEKDTLTVISQVNDAKTKKKVQIQNYFLKTCVMCDIVVRCIRVGISTNLLLRKIDGEYFCGPETVKDIFTTEPENKNKETLLTEVACDILSGEDYSHRDLSEIQTGIDMIKKACSADGIH